MLHIEDHSCIKMSGDCDDMLIELAQLVVSYQYCMDSAKKRNERDLNDLKDTLFDVAKIAFDLYMDSEYRTILDQSVTNIVDISNLDNILKNLDREE